MRARLGMLMVIALGAACSFPRNPDTELFSCATTADCGTGDVCVIQKLSGKGVCFPVSQCSPETCNGLDDDCDGVTDDVADAGGVCTSALHGACARGTLQCGSAGALECVPLVSPQPESCDGFSDLDCDGLVGCTDPDCDGTSACGSGCVCADGGSVETDCADGLDNDGDGKTDCADSDCEGRSCGTGCLCAGGHAVETDCGDGVDNDGDGLVDCDDPDCLSLGCGLGGNCGFSGPLVTDAGIIDAGSPPLDGGLDGGDLDAGGPDAGGFDAGASDGGDAGSDDAGSLDGGDAGSDDAGPDDGGPFDAGSFDAGPVDAGSFDAGADAGPIGAGNQDGGVDAGAIDAGPYCAARELVCDNGLDDDGDGRTDCLDADCLGRRCADGGTCLVDGGCR